jgi:DNA-binding NtrC family response regulator
MEEDFMQTQIIDETLNLPGHVQVSALAVSGCAEYLLFLEDKFKEANWKLYKANSYREALLELTRWRGPVVLCECQLPDGNWKDVLSQLAPMLDRPRLVVFSRHADERLWAEVLNLGAFDLLMAPFREDELVFTIGSAWLDWELEQEWHRYRRTRAFHAGPAG